MYGCARFESLRHGHKPISFVVDDGIGRHGREQIHLLFDAAFCACMNLARLRSQDQQREAHRKRQFQDNEADRQLAADCAVAEPSHPYLSLQGWSWVTHLSLIRGRDLPSHRTHEHHCEGKAKSKNRARQLRLQQNLRCRYSLQTSCRVTLEGTAPLFPLEATSKAARHEHNGRRSSNLIPPALPVSRLLQAWLRYQQQFVGHESGRSR